MMLSAGHRPQPLGELERSPAPLSRNRGRVHTSRGREKEGERKGRGGREKGG